MPSAVVGILRALLTSNSAEFSRQMGDSSKAVTKFSRDTAKMGRQATAIGQTFTRAFTVPIVAGGLAVAKMAIDFESSFAGVRKTVDATESELADLALGFRELSREIPINVNEINRVGEAAGQLGIKTENIVEFTRTMSLLGVTTNLSADEAATSLARLANITGMSQTNFDRLGSTIVDLGNRFATTEQEIVELGLRLAGAGNTIGLSEAQILGLAAALSSVGVRAEAGGTALSRVMIEIASAVDTGGDAVKEFANVAMPGMTDAGAKFSKLWREDAAAALDLFVQGLGKVKDSGSSIFKTLKDLEFGNVRVRDSMLRLAGAGDLLSRNFEVANNAWRENSALTEEARKRFETTASQLTLLWNRIKDIGITIGNALLPMIQATITLLDRILPAVAAVAGAFARAPVGLQVFAVALAGLVAAAPVALLVFGQLAFAASSLAAGFTASGVATVGLLGPLARVTGALRRGLPTFLAWGAAGVSVFSAMAGKLAAAVSGGVGLSTVMGMLGPAVAIVATGFGAWALGRWIGEVSGLTDKVEFLALRMRGLSAEQIKEIQDLRKLDKELAKVRDGYSELSDTLEALAAKDMAAWTGASIEARLEAQRLAANLPFAIVQVELLAEKTLEMAKAQKLTPLVMREVGRQAVALEAAVGKLPPVLQSIADWFKRSGDAAEEFIGDDESGVIGATEATKEYEEELKKLVDRMGGTDTIRKGRLLIDTLDRIGGVTKLSKAEQVEMRGELTKVFDKYVALGESAPPALMAILDVLRLLTSEVDILAGRDLDTLPLFSRPLEIPDIIGPIPRGTGTKGLLARLLGFTPREIGKLETLIGDFARRVPGIIVGAIQGGGDVGGAIGAALGGVFGGAVAEQIAESIGGAFGQAMGAVAAIVGPIAGEILFGAGSRTTKELVLAGTALGASIGTSILPGIGTAIGAGIGAFVGVFRGIGRSTADNIGLTVGRQWGLAISEELREAIAEEVKSGKFTSDIGALYGNLGRVIAENGGILEVGLEKTIALTRDLFVMIAQGNLTTAQAGKQLEEMFGLLLPEVIDRTTGEIRADFLELIDLLKEFGLESEQITRAIGDTLTELADLTAERSALLGDVAREGAARIGQMIEAGFGAATRRAGDAIETALTPSKLNVAVRAVEAMFQQMIASGATFQEALEAFGPGAIATLAQNMRAAGLEMSPLFEAMRDGAAIFADEGLRAIVEEGQLAGDTLQTLATLGVVTADDFSILGANVEGTFRALVAGGSSAEGAMLALRPQIATLIRLQDEYGFQVDAATQALIDQGRAAGITGDEGKSAADKQLDAWNKMIAALELIVELLGGEIPREADKLGDMEIGITTKFEVDPSDINEAIGDLSEGISVPVRFEPGNLEDIEARLPPGGGGSPPFVPSFFGQHGTPGFDFASFGGETGAMLHGDEAVIPRGGGHELAAEIAAAMGGAGITVKIEKGAVVVEGIDEGSGERVLLGLAAALEKGGRPVSRFVGAVRSQQA